jgi:hypothetical protein
MGLDCTIMDKGKNLGSSNPRLVSLATAARALGSWLLFGGQAHFHLKVFISIKYYCFIYIYT